ncbi:TolC family outer membrane protein [uncultured Cohaesibacter sp.]|uniref:TolC family outer membrane protein n=1 Tax=uncultured Cohaesibacter sp. TaxID=1002546 RepID=UPI0029C6EAE9|nr:TolC family outer membrane protein [uncultured Cohaesibacter sp.]
MTLGQAIEQAVQTNPKILARVGDKKVEQTRLRQATGRYLPTVDISLDAGQQKIDQPNGLVASRNNKWNVNRQATAQVGLVLFEGFDRANHVYGQIARLNASALRILEESEQVALQTTEAYLDLLRHRRILAIVNQNIATHQRYLAKIERAYNGGSAIRGDVVQARERLRSAESVVGEVEQALGTVEAKFINLTGQKPEKLDAVRYPSGMPKNIAAAMEKAHSDNPSCQAVEKDIDALGYDRKRAGSSFLPTVSLVGRASYGEDVNAVPGRRHEEYAGVQLSWNIFNGGITKAREDEQIERQSNRKIYLEQLLRDIDQSIRTAWVTMSSNDKRLTALKRQIEEGQALVAAYEREFDAGQRSYLDLLSADGSLTNLRMELASTETIALFARYQVLASMGGLLEHFHIAPVAETGLMERPRSAAGFALSNGFVIKPLGQK